MRDVSAEYEAGLWVPSNYGSVYVPTKKNAGIPTSYEYYDGNLRKTLRAYGVTEQDLTFKARTVADAQTECDRRNAAEGSSETPPGQGGETV